MNATTSKISSTRSLLPWYSAEFLASFAANLYIQGCYDWADIKLGTTPSTRLWFSALWGFEYIFIAILAGKAVEKFGPRAAAVTLSGLCVLSSLAGLLAIQFPFVWMVPVVMLLFNITCSMIWPAIESGVTRSPGSTPLSTRMAIFNLSWGSAGFAATFFRGMLENLSFSAIFIAPAIACGIGSLILWKWAVPASMIRAHNVPDDPKGEHELDDPAVRRRAELLLKMAWIGNALSYVAIYVLLPVMTQLIQAAGVKDLAWVGMIASIWFVVRFASFGIAGTWTGWHYKISWQIGPLLGLAGSLCLMLLLHRFGLPPSQELAALIGLQVIFGFSAAMLYSASLYYAMHVSSGHGGHAAFHEAVIGAGTMGGPLIGALASMGKSDEGALQRVAYSVTAFLAIGIGAIVWLALRKPKAVQSEHHEPH